MSWLDYFLSTPSKPPASGRDQQEAALATLHQAATGQTPSAADAELRTQTGRNINAAYAIGNTIQARSPATAARTAITAVDDANANATQQGTALRAQEQALAEQQYLTGASAVRQGDLSQEGIDQQNSASKNAFLGGLFGGVSSAAMKGLG